MKKPSLVIKIRILELNGLTEIQLVQLAYFLDIESNDQLKWKYHLNEYTTYFLM